MTRATWGMAYAPNLYKFLPRIAGVVAFSIKFEQMRPISIISWTKIKLF
jgi:hypothetical protein